MQQRTQLKRAEHIAEIVANTLEEHLKEMTQQDHPTENVYRMVLDAVEPAVIGVMLKKTQGNQSAAAKQLGINRATLRSKMKQHNQL